MMSIRLWRRPALWHGWNWAVCRPWQRKGWKEIWKHSWTTPLILCQAEEAQEHIHTQIQPAMCLKMLGGSLMPSAISKVYVQPQLTDTQTHGLYSFFPYIMHEKQMMLPGEAKSQLEKVDCCVYYTLCCDMGLHQQITWHLKSLQTAETIPLDFKSCILCLSTLPPEPWEIRNLNVKSKSIPAKYCTA